MRRVGDRRQRVRDLDILILGPVPPPFGGISVHVSRLVAVLVDAGFRVGVLNHFRSTTPVFVLGALKRNPLNYYRLPKRFPAPIVHYHHSRWLHLVAFAAGRQRADTKYIVTLHAGDIRNHLPQLISRLPFMSRITCWALRRFDVIITVDPMIATIVREHVPGRRIEVVPAFLASAGRELERYEPTLEDFLSRGCGLVVAAYGVQFLGDGGELYGLDTVVEAFTVLAKERPDLWLALFIARRPTQRKARRHFVRLEEQLERAGLGERVRILFGLSLLPALRPNAIFVRPTRAEGDAVSVREALSAGLRVVASDVITRPPGVETFAVGDAADLCTRLRPLLDRLPGEPIADTTLTRREPEEIDPFAATLIRLYRAEGAGRATGNVNDR